MLTHVLKTLCDFHEQQGMERQRQYCDITIQKWSRYRHRHDTILKAAPPWIRPRYFPFEPSSTLWWLFYLVRFNLNRALFGHRRWRPTLIARHLSSSTIFLSPASPQYRDSYRIARFVYRDNIMLWRLDIVTSHRYMCNWCLCWNVPMRHLENLCLIRVFSSPFR